MLAAYVINWGRNPFLKRCTWFIKKSKQFNQSDIISDISALTLTLTLNKPLNMIGCACDRIFDVLRMLVRMVYMIYSVCVCVCVCVCV